LLTAWDPRTLPRRNGTRRERYGKGEAMTNRLPASPRLIGRGAELEILFRLVDCASERGGALVVRGEPGVGKTSLLEAAIRRATDGGARVLRTVGAQSETDLAFSGLHQLVLPVLTAADWAVPGQRAALPGLSRARGSTLDRLEQLPEPQQRALRAAFGLGAGAAPGRLLVGLAVLSLLSEAAEERPLLCVVDDAQWLDRASAQTMAFVARRLLAERVAIVFAERESSDDLQGLPELLVEGLCDKDARALLGSVVRGPLDERVRERLVAESRGNPLALVELLGGRSSSDLAGGFGWPDVVSLSGRIEESFLRRLEALPEETQLFLLVAAAEPGGDPGLLWRAAGRLGLSREAGAYAESAGLLEIGVWVRFQHPLARSAVYRTASLTDRQRAHRALAEVTGPDVDPERRAWHRAQAASSLDEEVAAELERSAGRAQRRGGPAAAAAFLERSVGLTRDPGRRARRALGAAQAKQQAGEFDAALALLAVATAGPQDDVERARVDMLRAQIAFASSRGSEAAPLLLSAAKRLEPLDARLARDTYLDALSAAQFPGRLAGQVGVSEVAQAALAAPPPSGPPRSADLLLEALTKRFTDGYAAAAPVSKRALSAFLSDDISREDELRWMWLPCRIAVDLWDDEAWHVLAGRHVTLARELGAFNELPLALSMSMSERTFTSGLTAAAELADEVETAAEATGTQLPPYGRLLLSAWRGREAEASELIEQSVRGVVPRGETLGLAAAQWASAVVYNGLGRYEDALAAAEQACEHPEDLGFFNWSLAELILAATRSGRTDRATDALERLSEMTRASGSDWALGIEARSRALLSEGANADRLYREAIERLGRTRVRVALARAHLQYGEWLRRERRRMDAREQLRIAYEMLTAMGVEAFAQRAERELLATGEKVRRRADEARD
jgi:tetratricopeptide (TPR) repeat protein